MKKTETTLLAEQDEMLAQAYQVIGDLLERAGLFESDEGRRCLDYFSTRVFDENFLPVRFEHNRVNQEGG